MLVFWIVVTMVCFITGSYEDQSKERPKRNLYQFANMIEGVTGRSWRDYNGYGCYCGVGGRGTPRDSLDWCCLRHDRCYDRVTANGCSPKWAYYHYRRNGRRITCYRAGNDDHCDLGACACDRNAAHCFGRSGYNNRYRKYKGRC